MKYLATLLLIGFVVIGFMSVSGCAFSSMGQSPCPSGAVASAIHHVSTYQAFLNVPVGVSLTVLLISLLLAAGALFVVSRRLSLLDNKLLSLRVLASPPDNLYQQRIIHWLSLLENSPA